MATKTELELQIAQLKAEKAELVKQERSEIKFKVSQKGAVSVYGMGRFPVTLYRQQWEKLLERKDDIIKFIADNADKLTTK